MSTVPSPAESSSAKSTKPSPRQPEKKIGPFAGGVGVCIWVNQVDTENGPRKLRSITINPRRYFDRESNQWKDAPSYNPTDLPALIFALQQAQAYVFETPLPGQQSAESSEVLQDGEIPF